jgi:DNA (cytosine-5)-methyltransferase 1
MNMSKLKGISLFSGAGGMDVGFEQASVDVVLANELDSNACDTYEANHPNSKLLRGDIKDFYPVFAEQQGIDIVFGGPPCQGFSVAGKMDPGDERSKLIWCFLDIVEMVKPRVFIMENVKALGKLEKWKDIRIAFLERAKSLGYFCQFYILNAADFGVSQNRERVFFIGSDNEYNLLEFTRVLNERKESPPPLGNLLRQLPPVGSKENPLTCTARITLAANPVMRKSPYAGMIFNGMGRPLNLDTVSSTLPASMGGNKTPIVDCKLLANPNDVDWVKEYHAGLMNGAIDPEFKLAPSHLRRLTILESALIQSFPPEYNFKGTKSAVYTQIGNAVPCKLAENVAKAAISVTLKGN